MINNILKKPAISNNSKESQINDILEESAISNNSEETISNSLEEPIINNLKEPTINKEKISNKKNNKKSINNSTFVKTPEWLRLKRSVLNPNNTDNKSFQYSTTLCLYHKQIGKNCCRRSKIEPHASNLNWENINYPPQKEDYEKFEMNNKSIALNILQIQDQNVSFHKK